MNWDNYFIKLTKVVAEKSKDISIKIGAIIVSDDNSIISTGFNGFPSGVDDDVSERYKRPKKYLYTAHAEQNAICQAAKKGSHTNECKIYLNGLPPCSTCARMIIQSGIKEVIYDCLEIPERWLEDCNVAFQMFKEANVKYRNLNGKYKT